MLQRCLACRVRLIQGFKPQGLKQDDVGHHEATVVDEIHLGIESEAYFVVSLALNWILEQCWIASPVSRKLLPYPYAARINMGSRSVLYG